MPPLKLFAVLLALCLASFSLVAGDVPVPAWKQCLEKTGAVGRLEALPGVGYDSLNNQDMSLVFDYTYNECKTTSDGKLLIPDGMLAIPLQKSQVKKMAEVVEHYNDYTDITSQSMKVSASFDMISGSFSEDYTQNKESQYFGKTVTTRTQLRHELYKVLVLPSAKLTPGFRDRLMRITSYYQNNNTDLALFETQLIVRDYGNSVTKQVTAGGILLAEDHISADYVKNQDQSHLGIKASASVNFFVSFNMHFSYSQDSKQVSDYNQNCVQSSTRAYGGSPYQPDFNLTDWYGNLYTTLVTVDRRGDPLDFLISPGTFPELPAPNLMQLKEGLTRALEKYSEVNTHPGCMDADSSNFDYHANLEDNSCKAPSNSYAFGGMYQQCTQSGSTDRDVCTPLTQKNPLTGDFSCPPGYDAILLHSGKTVQNWNKYLCHDETKHCGLWGLSRCHQNVCGTKFFAATASYTLHWCAALGKVPTNSGFLFGGLFTNSLPNPVTQSRTCPKNFYPLKAGASLSVCVSDDFEQGYGSSLRFGGLYSCSVGNPLAMNRSDSQQQSNGGISIQSVGFGMLSGADHWKKACATTYAQHLATIDDNCEIHYCVKTGTFNKPPPLALKRPPYGADQPRLSNNTVSPDMIIAPDGKTWKRNSTTGEWSPLTETFNDGTGAANVTDADDAGLDNSTQTGEPTSPRSKNKFSGGQTAGIAVGLAVVAIVLTALFMSLCKRRRPESPLSESIRGSGKSYDAKQPLTSG